MHDIRARLLRAEDDLLLALSSGSLETFENEWFQLSHEITLATKERWLPEAIQALASTVSTRIHAIASFFLDLDTKCQELMMEEVEGIIFKETQSNCQSPASTKSAIPPYIPLAYAWLLDNLHCPYPSTSMRDSLAEKSGSLRKAIDGWFIDVRKRIGWNALRRTRFCGKKDEIIHAASLFFCENKSNDNLGLEFASIEAAARDLYAEKLRPSALVSRFAEAVDRRPSKKDDSASVSPRQYIAYPAPSSSYRTTPSSKRTRSFDEIEPETPDLTHPCRRPSKRQRRVTSKLPSPVSSRGISKPRSSSPGQQSHPFSESHSLPPNVSQWPIPDSNSNSSHQVSKQAKSAQGASTVMECNHASSSREPKSSVIHLGNCSSEVQLSLRDENSSVSDVSQMSHRCISKMGSQLPSGLKNKSPHLQSASDSVFNGSSGVTGWSFEPEVVQSESVFGSLDSTTECEVATFDFSTWSPENLNQTDLSLPLQVSSSGVQMGFPQPSIPSAFIATFSDDNLGALNNAEPFGDELLEIFDFFHETPSKAGSATFPTPLPLHETVSFNAGLGSKLDNGISHVAEPFSWDVPDNVQNFLGPLAQQSAAISESEPTTNLSEDDKLKKLKLLAEVQEFAHRLQAEIAVM